MRRYHPDYFKPMEEITMTDIETFYSSGLIRQETGSAVTICAPLLVCMALHGKTEEIQSLLEKFPLVDVSGWTRELKRKEEKSYLFLVDRSGQKTFVYLKPISMIDALAFSDVREEEYRELKNRLWTSSNSRMEDSPMLDADIRYKFVM